MNYKQLKERIKKGNSLQLEEIVAFSHEIISISRIVPDYYELEDFPRFIEEFEKGEYILGSQQALKSSEQQENIRSILLAKSAIYFKLGKLDDSLELLKKCENLSRDLDDEKGLADTYLFLGDLHGVMGDISLAMDYYEKATRVFKDLCMDTDYPFVLNHIGAWFAYLGETNYSYQYFQRALGVSKQVGSLSAKAVALHSIGWFYQTIGELDQALSYFHQCLKEAENVNSDPIGLFHAFLLWPLQNIGDIYNAKGNLPTAADFYERSLAISEENNNILAIAWNLYYLISLALDSNSPERAQKYFDRFSTLNEKIGTQATINAMYNLSEALILRVSSLSPDRIRAQKLLNDVIDKRFPQQKIKVHAMLALCELLLSELAVSDDKTPRNESLISKLRELSEKLQEIAKHQTSFLLQAELSFLQAQLAEIDLDFAKAQDLLNQAQKIAEKKGLRKLAERITAEYYKILKKGGTAFHILLLLLTYQEMNLRKLSESLQISKTGVLRHLRPLIDMNMVKISREEQVRSKQMKAKYYMLGPAAIRFFQPLNISLWRAFNESSKYSLTLGELIESYQIISKFWQNLADLFISSLEDPSRQKMIAEEDRQLLLDMLSEDDVIQIRQYFLSQDQYKTYLELWKEFTEKVDKKVLQGQFYSKQKTERTKHVFHAIFPLQMLLETNRIKKKREKRTRKRKKKD
ncbi:MAG: tetratricopeptide repeat protein [Candidatus Hodarchaeota archaeon]